MYPILLSSVVAAHTLFGNGVGGKMTTAPHYSISVHHHYHYHQSYTV